MELELVVGSKDEEKEAEEKLRQVARELDIQIMSDEELFDFTQALEKDYDERVRKGKQSRY